MNVDCIDGWALNLFSNKGKLNIYISFWDDNLRKKETLNGNLAEKKRDVKYFTYTCSMDVYNSSGNTKIMRNIKVIFSDSNNNTVKIFIPKNGTKKFDIMPYDSSNYDDVTALNVPPKSVRSLTFHNLITGDDAEFDSIWAVRKICLQYSDEKKKVKTKKLKVCD